MEDWTQEQIDTIIELAPFVKYGDIAKVVKHSRNAVSGKIWRLRLEGKISPKVIILSSRPPRIRRKIIKAKPIVPPPEPKVIKMVAPIPIEDIEIDPNRVTIANVTGCRYPLHKHERGINMELCGRPTNSSWCVEHKALVFQPRQPRKIRDRQRV